MTTTTTAVVGYLRQWAAQPADAVSVGRDALHRLAAARSLDLRRVYVDEPGRHGDRGQRVGFAAALADVRKRRAAGLLVLDVEHLSRHPEVRECLTFLVTGAGGELFVAEESERELLIGAGTVGPEAAPSAPVAPAALSTPAVRRRPGRAVGWSGRSGGRTGHVAGNGHHPGGAPVASLANQPTHVHR